MSSDGNICVPLEIITDILLRLPAKSLGRFRCVSKEWLSLISNPQFIETHQNTNNRNHLMFIYDHHSLCSINIQNLFHQKETNVRPKMLHFRPQINVMTVYGSCNGLLLGLSNYGLVVLNPTTTEFVKIQESPFVVECFLSEMEIMYGFGHDSSGDDYKVVIISYFHNHYLTPPDCMFVHVYSLQNKTWRMLKSSPYDHSHGSLCSGVLVNGFLHWIAVRLHDRFSVIVAFSLADETFREVPLPYLRDDIFSKENCKLVDLGGKLAIFRRNGEESDVWVMNEYGVKESWTQILIHGLSGNFVPMCLVESGKILVASDDMVCLYNVDERTVCYGIVISRQRGVLKQKVEGVCVESLVSPKLRNGMR